ncbi:hypothetical protein WMY93_010802 [Mugilogobius chulae]|uniref:Coiled-coil domain-containing protein 57 n=1 Tax=Mugilogobius chulae TaxID=88201 RepID=A0AAW0PLA8_9GOBI
MSKMEQQDQTRKIEASEALEESTTGVNIKRAQACPGENHKGQIEEVQKAISKLQKNLDMLSAQALCMKTQHQKQLQERENIMDRYKKELSTSLEREKLLEQRVVQQELEWQKNCGDIQSKLYLEHEQLVQELSAARDKVNAELVETKIQLQELTVLLQCVTKERDQALQRCIPDTELQTSDEIIALKQQNCRLQAVVSEMRKQMEELSCTSLLHSTDNNVNKEVEISKKDIQHLEPSITNVNEKKSSCVCSCGRVNSENSASAQLRSRLKQAALCIARLNRDRQQLIEICNRLRAQVCTADVLNQSYRSCTKQHRVYESTNNLKVENLENEPRVHVDRELLTTQLQANKQSEESLPSLSALWALLDQKPSQDFSEDNSENPVNVQPEVPGGAQMEVCGVSAPVHKQSTAKPPPKRRLLKTSAKSARIRNYNIKD